MFAGATVVVALAGLSLVGIPFLTVMGLAVATGGRRLVLPLEASEIVIATTVAGARCRPAYGGLPVVDSLSGDYSTKSGRYEATCVDAVLPSV